MDDAIVWFALAIPVVVIVSILAFIAWIVIKVAKIIEGRSK